MLNLEAPVIVAEAPEAAVYADDRDPWRFYAFAARPRIALDDAGKPQLSVLIWRRGRDAPPEGGQITVTTTLALTPDEQAAVARAVAPPPRAAERAAGTPVAAVVGGAMAGPAGQTRSPIIVAPDWLAGEVTVHLAEGLELHGQPSLSGANTCALASSLDAAGASAALRAVEGGLVEAKAQYSVDIAVGRSMGDRTEHSERGPHGASSYRYEIAVTHADRERLDLVGPLSIRSANPTDVLTTIGF